MSDIETIVLDLRKKFGEQSIFILGKDERAHIKVRSSGSLMLDLALGGGYPQGRMIEFRGQEKSGKTTLACLAIAEAQVSEPDKLNAIIDLEHSFNPEWAKVLGVDINKLLVSQPDTYAEKIYEMIEEMLQSGKFAIIVVDSVASMICKEEFEEKDWEASKVGLSARVNAKAMRRLVSTGLLQKSGTTLIFINQLREKIGAFSLYGTSTETPGGRALRHNYSQILEVALGEQFVKGTGDNKQVLGQQIKIRCIKNKIAPPYRTATIDLYYDTGVDRITELVNVAKTLNILSGSNWLKLINPLTGEVILDEQGNEIKFNGFAKTVEAIKEDLTKEGKLYDLIFNLVNEVIRNS